MPWTFSNLEEDTILVSRLDGILSKPSLMDYYHQYLNAEYFSKYKKEIVDGRGISKVLCTASEQQQFVDLISKHPEELRGSQVAMVADNPVAYGMFRMFEIQRDDLAYEVRVFREFDEALKWLTATNNRV